MNDLETKELIKIISSANEETQIYLAKTAPIKVICEMTLEKIKPLVLEIILRRLEENKDTEEVKNIALKLANSFYLRVQEFAVKTAPIEVLYKITLIEKSDNIIDIILSRLENEKETDIVKNICNELANSEHWKIRKFAAKIAPLNLVCNMILTEKDVNVLEVLLSRLENEKESNEVKNICSKLVNSNYWKIRQFAAKIAPLKVVCEMALYERDGDIIDTIISRLEAEKETKEIINICNKLTTSMSWIIREFAVQIVSIEKLYEMTLSKENDDIIDTIISRLEAEKETNEVKDIYSKLINSENKLIREFALNTISLDKLKEIVLKNEDEKVKLALYKLLE